MATDKPNMTLEVWAGGSDNQGNGNVIAENDPLLPPKMTAGFTAEIPRYDIFNYPLARADQFAHHINENGFAEWDTNTSYEAKAWVKDPTDGEIYISKVSTQGQQPSLNAPAVWELRSTFLNGDVFTNSIDNNGGSVITFNGNTITDINIISGVNTIQQVGADNDLRVEAVGTDGNVSLAAAGQIRFLSDTWQTGGTYQFSGSYVSIGANSFISIASALDATLTAGGGHLTLNSTSASYDVQIESAKNIELDASGQVNIDGSKALSEANANTSVLSTTGKSGTTAEPGHILITEDYCKAWFAVNISPGVNSISIPTAVPTVPAGFYWRGEGLASQANSDLYAFEGWTTSANNIEIVNNHGSSSFIVHVTVFGVK